MNLINLHRLVLAAALPLAACTPPGPVQPVEGPSSAPPAPMPAEIDDDLRATMLGGEAPVVVPPEAVKIEPKRGDISLNFPSTDVRIVAKAVLGDILKLRYAVAPNATAQVNLVTPAPVARSSLLPLLESSLRNAGLALVPFGTGYEIQPVALAQQRGPISPESFGYGTEVLTLQFTNADQLKRLFDSVLPNVVIAADPAANTLTVAGTTGQRASARDLVRQFDVNWLRGMSFGLFVPQRSDSRLIVPELDKVLNAADAPTRGLVRLISMEKLNGILAISRQPQYLEDVRRWIEILDREGESNEAKLFVYRVQNGRARDLAKTLNSAFGQSGSDSFNGANGSTTEETPAPVVDAAAPPPPRANTSASREVGASSASGSSAAPIDQQNAGRITADEANNAIIVFGTARQFAVVEDALRKLDIPPLQVMIEAAITEVSLTDQLRYGVQWNFVNGDANFTLGEGTTTAPTRNLPGFSVLFSNSDITATLNALEQRTNVKVVSAPKLLVLNNQTASLQVGDQVPILTQSSVGVQDPDSPIVNSVQYRDTGVILRITPRVNANGLVLLDIAQEVSDVSETSTSTIDSPTIATRRIATSIAVQDRQVIALGGLFRDSRSFGKNGLPILSRIPVLGSLLFGNSRNLQRRTELIVLLKPHVVRSIDDGRAITEELRAKLRTLEPFKTEGRIP